MQKNNEAWCSFFSLLKLKREGRLPPHITRVSPPSYWKEHGERKRILVIRQDRYAWMMRTAGSSSRTLACRLNLLADWCGLANSVDSK